MLDTLRAGHHFVTTGEVLLPGVQFGGTKSGDTLELTDTKEFGACKLKAAVDLTGRTWAPLEVWDVAANGAFTAARVDRGVIQRMTIFYRAFTWMFPKAAEVFAASP